MPLEVLMNFQWALTLLVERNQESLERFLVLLSNFDVTFNYRIVIAVQLINKLLAES